MATARSGHLATVRPDARPQVVVVTFALVDGTVVTAVDQKPKKTNRLQRVVNIENNPFASFLVDHYDDDWTRLWWVRVDGAASLHLGDELHHQAVDALRAKYHQYEDHPPMGQVIAISQDQVSSWSYTG